MQVAVVIVAAGRSRRMGGETPKVYQDLGGRPVLAWSLDTVARWNPDAPVVLVVRDEDRPRATPLVEAWAGSQAVQVVSGGAERQDSVRAGLAALEGTPVSHVLVHDAARPMASVELFQRVADAARAHHAAVPGVPVADTLRRRDESGMATVSREGLFSIQTPQGFQVDLLRRAHLPVDAAHATDDAVLVEALGSRVELVEGEAWNRKITQPQDLDLLRRLAQAATEGGAEVRVGMGQDLHRLRQGGPLRLGGVDVPADVSAVGHSDGDVLLHAITDAVLGALALGDIGQHFSDQDAAHKGRDSATMLAHALTLAGQHGFQVAQVDATVHLQRPRIGPSRDAMRQCIATLAGIAVDRVSVKAKTGEGLGPIGEGLAIASEALIQLRRRSDAAV